MVGHAVVTGIGKKKKQRGRSESDAPPKKKEFLRRQHDQKCPGCLLSVLYLSYSWEADRPHSLSRIAGPPLHTQCGSAHRAVFGP